MMEQKGFGWKLRSRTCECENEREKNNTTTTKRHARARAQVQKPPQKFTDNKISAEHETLYKNKRESSPRDQRA